ncbi:hypothetical protein K501DRAFT_267244 [Backusella circina FSU 941]|nr:hypothetical protein K501DRAFT_267244 [Backusella circina FSU 941]
MLNSTPIVLIVVIVLLTCLNGYTQFVATPSQQRFSFTPVIPLMKHINTIAPPPPELEYKIDDVCKLVDFQWLASDRVYWDGWISKSMFMKKDGQFTRKTVDILERETVCIVVLLGPIPAIATIRPEIRYAPPDSIVMSVKGASGTSISVRLQQHAMQSNAYFAAITFPYRDRYKLESSVEYRSYFWEQPMFHHSNKAMMTGSNELIVSRLSVEQQELKPCKSDLQGIWMRKIQLQQRDPLRYYSEFRKLFSKKSDTFPVFVPSHCELKHAGQEKCLGSKTVHAWGDAHLRRNIQSLKGSISWCNTDANACMCNEMKDQIVTNKPLNLIANTKVHFGSMDSITDNVNDWKVKITSTLQQLSKADIVILGVGSDDLIKLRQSPSDFAVAFSSLLDYLVHHVYLTETIIIRTPQYAGSSIMKTGWNPGRSEAYANIVRSTVANLSPHQKTRIILWDTHKLGGGGFTTCCIVLWFNECGCISSPESLCSAVTGREDKKPQADRFEYGLHQHSMFHNCKFVPSAENKRMILWDTHQVGGTNFASLFIVFKVEQKQFS